MRRPFSVGLTIFLVKVATAQPGSLDPSFGTGGMTTTNIDWMDWGQALVIRPDGRILQSGTSFSDTSAIIFVQYLPDGSLDQSFGTEGKVLIGNTYIAQGGGMAVLSDGRAYACGAMGSSTLEMALVRILPDGELDPSFGSDGIATTDAGVLALGMQVQADGKVVLAGIAENDTTDQLFIVARFTSDGTLDPSFGDAGIVTPFPELSTARCLALQPDGRIVAAGNAPGLSGADVALARFEPDGTLDPSFGMTGTIVTAVGLLLDAADAIAVQPDGKIILAGLSSQSFDEGADMVVLRYTPEGALDPGFSGDGILLVDLNGGNDRAYSVLVQPDGRIIVAGRSEPADNAITLVRLTPDGALDATFGGDGKVVFPMTDDTDAAYAVAMDAEGRIVIGGTTAEDLIVARLFSGLEVGLAELDPLAVSGSIHPTPATDVAYLELRVPSGSSMIAVELLDQQGRKVRSLAVEQPFTAGERTVPITLSGLAPGCYSVRVTIDGRRTRFPLFKV